MKIDLVGSFLAILIIFHIILVVTNLIALFGQLFVIVNSGDSLPLGFFDPLGFTKGASAATLTKYRESELKHGRTAMVNMLTYK